MMMMMTVIDDDNRARDESPAAEAQAGAHQQW